jgi:hypothetical protein
MNYTRQQSYGGATQDRYSGASDRYTGGSSQPQNGQATGDPLEKKIMVLYIKSGDPNSETAVSWVRDYPEIWIQDVLKLQSIPHWLKGVPTVVTLNNKKLHEGHNAFQILKSYIDTMQRVSGPQNTLVVPTMSETTTFRVVDRDSHARACVDENLNGAPPLGTSSRTPMTVGQVNFGQHDDPRYNNTKKGISESDIDYYRSMREQKRPPPQVQYLPSVLDNGELVTM